MLPLLQLQCLNTTGRVRLFPDSRANKWCLSAEPWWCVAGEVGKGLGRSDRTPLSQRATHRVGLHLGKKGAWQSKEVSEAILFQAVQIQWKSATWESRAAAWHWCWPVSCRAGGWGTPALQGQWLGAWYHCSRRGCCSPEPPTGTLTSSVYLTSPESPEETWILSNIREKFCL